MILVFRLLDKQSSTKKKGFPTYKGKTGTRKKKMAVFDKTK
jgi:hypothetical protein